MTTAIAVLGYEGSGSVFLAQIVSHAVGTCATFGDWHGYGFNRPLGAPGIVLHRSIPYMRPKKWHDDPAEICAIFACYDEVRFIIATRDLSASVASRMHRFGGTPQDYEADTARATRFFAKVLATQTPFIWSFEAMCALRQAYVQTLYDWLGSDCCFAPEIIDANAKYFQPAGGGPI